MFISEPITPERGAFDPQMMARGLASLPASFIWRNRRYRVVECICHAKCSSREGGRAGGELYLRRQEFTVRLDTGQQARLYLQRQPPRGAKGPAARQRWFLLEISPQSPSEPAEDEASPRAPRRDVCQSDDHRIP